jgi:uncharacterized protein
MKLGPEERRIVADILRQHVPDHEVWAFGSRVHGKHLKPFSDLDLAIITTAPLPLQRLIDLRTAFSESDMPFRVDIVDWAAAELSFRSIIDADHEVVTSASKDAGPNAVA